MNQLPGAGRDSYNDLRDALDQLFTISNFLKCGVSKETLAIMTSLIDKGVKPEHVAAIVA